MSRKTRTLLAVLASISMVLAACSSSGSGSPDSKTSQSLQGSPEYKGKLTLLTKFGTEQLSPYFKKMAKKYEKKHPKVKVTLDQENDESIKTKTKTLVSSDSLPDIYFTWTGDWQKQFIRGKRAIDLTKVISPKTDWGKTFAPSALDAFKSGHKYYTIPLYSDGKFMGYNKKYFEKAGIKKPKTYEDLIHSCGQLKQRGTTPISLGNKEGWPVLHYAGQLIGYNVPRSVQEKDYNPKTATYQDSGYETSLKQLKQLITHCTKGASTNGVSYSDAIESSINGDAAMYYQEILEFDQSNDKKKQLHKDGFDFFQLPAPENEKQRRNVVEGAPEGYMINSASKHPKLALDFMKFVTNKENAKLLIKPPYGQPSTVRGAVTKETTSKAVAAGTKKINHAKYLVPWLDTANDPDVADTWKSQLQKLVSGKASPKSVMSAVRKASKDAD